MFFQLCAAVFADDSAGRSGLRGCGLIPDPGSPRVGRHKYVVAAASLDDIPGDPLLQIARVRAHVFELVVVRGRRDKSKIGPGTVLFSFCSIFLFEIYFKIQSFDF